MRRAAKEIQEMSGIGNLGPISRAGFAETLKLYMLRDWSCLKEGKFLRPSDFLIKVFFYGLSYHFLRNQAEMKDLF